MRNAHLLVIGLVAMLCIAAGLSTTTQKSAMDRESTTFREDCFNVKDKPYGAVGDGVADDTMAIQSALDAARRAGGGTVFIPAGTYKTTADLIIGSSTSLTGTGRGISIIKRHSTDAVVAVLKNFDRSAKSADTDITMSDLTIWREGEAKPANSPLDNAIQLWGVTRASVRNCRVRGGGKGIHFHDCHGPEACGNTLDAFVDNGIAINASSNFVGNGRITANHFDTPAPSGFVLGSSSLLCTQGAMVMCNNTFIDCATNAIECGYNGGEPPSRLLIANNVISSSGAAKTNNSILFTDRVNNSLITGNVINKGSIYTSCLDAANHFNNGIQITNNAITDGGIILQNTKTSMCRGNQITRGSLSIKTCEDIAVCDNSISGASGGGVHLLRTHGGSFANRRIQVHGNVSFNNGTARTPGTRCGIIIDQGEFIEVTANRCYDTGGGDQLYGLYVNAAANLRDAGNDFTGNANGARDAFTGVVSYAGDGNEIVGSPEGRVTAPPGSIARRLDGGPGKTLYVKESATGNTGWSAK